jgi:UrcA family protein
MRTLAPLFTVPVLLAALSHGAHADTSIHPTNSTGRSVVFYGDLNLNVEPDARIMLLRIERAAKTACGGHAAVSSYTGSLDQYTFDECRAKAVQRTVKQLGAPTLTRIYSEDRK